MKQQQRVIAKNRGFIYRYPRLFVTVTTSAALLTLFSKPIYDIFFSDQVIDLEELRRTHKSKFGKN